MTRFSLRLLPLVFVLFTLIIAAIRSQPYHDDSELWESLGAGDCGAGCLFGITPGHTTSAELEQILRANPWINYFNVNVSGTRDAQFVTHVYQGSHEIPDWRPDYASIEVNFEWNGSQPDYLRESGWNVVLLVDDKVHALEIKTNIHYGSYLVTLGEPDVGGFRCAYSSQYGYMLRGMITEYVAKGIGIRTAIQSGLCREDANCRYRYSDFLHSDLTTVYLRTTGSTEGPTLDYKTLIRRIGCDYAEPVR